MELDLVRQPNVPGWLAVLQVDEHAARWRSKKSLPSSASTACRRHEVGDQRTHQLVQEPFPRTEVVVQVADGDARARAIPASEARGGRKRSLPPAPRRGSWPGCRPTWRSGGSGSRRHRKRSGSTNTHGLNPEPIFIYGKPIEVRTRWRASGRDARASVPPHEALRHGRRDTRSPRCVWLERRDALRLQEDVFEHLLERRVACGHHLQIAFDGLLDLYRQDPQLRLLPAAATRPARCTVRGQAGEIKGLPQLALLSGNGSLSSRAAAVLIQSARRAGSPRSRWTSGRRRAWAGSSSVRPSSTA